jgi:dienelactone hydrolase
VYGEKLATMPNMTLEHETVLDAIAAVELLRGMKEIDAATIVIAGHSLGGFAAPRIAVRIPQLGGVAILAGNASGDIAQTMLDQLQYIATVDERQASALPALIEQVKAAAARIRELQAGAKPKPGELVLGAGAAYWIDLAHYDPIATVKKVTAPIFVAQGGRDYQVTRNDYDAWHAALATRKDVTFKLYPELNHVFGAGSGTSTPQEYEQRTPVDVHLVDDLAAWVKGL